MCQPGRPGAAIPHGVCHTGSPGLDGFHSTKSGGLLLVGRDLDPRAGDHLVQRPPRQLAVVRHRLGVEQHVALGGVGVA